MSEMKIENERAISDHIIFSQINSSVKQSKRRGIKNHVFIWLIKD